MSLINKMLRDLDARQAPNVDRSALEGMRTLPSAPARDWTRIAVGVLLVVAFAVWWRIMSVPTPPAVVVPPPLPRPAAVPAAPPPPPPVASSPAEPEAPPAVAPPAEPEPAPAADKPRTATAVPRAQGRPAPQKPAPVPETAAPTAAAPAPPVDTTPAAIDKRSRSTPAHEAAEAEYRKGMTALRRGTTSDAVASFRLALNLEQSHVSARQALLAVLVEQQQWNEALALMEEGLALDPTQIGWAMTLARLQIERGKLTEAGETLARHAAHAEQNADYLAFQAVVLQRQKRHADAAQRYRAALALRPAESRWWYGLGLALEAEHKAPEARAAFQQARDAGNLPPELLAAVNQRLRLP